MNRLSHPAVGPKVPILMYHQVVEDGERNRQARNTNPAYTVTVGRFREQMAWLAENGFRTRSLGDVIDPPIPLKDSVVITFDDGWADNFSHALPVLGEYGLSATIFVVTGFVGAPGYLDWEQLREMSGNGISLQSHTVSHRPLEELGDDEVAEELGASKKVLEDRMGTAVHFVSMPQGSWNRKIFQAVRAAGYRGVCTSEPGFRHSLGTPAVFSRINVADRTPISSFARIARMDRSFILPVLAATKFKRAVRSLVGYRMYRLLYRLRYRINEEGN